MSQESYEKWHPLEHLPKCLYGVSLITNRDGDLLIICHCAEDFGSDILLNFGYLHAYQVHEEFAHPWLDIYPNFDFDFPKSSQGGFTFPFLKVNDSIWLNTFSEIRRLALPNNPLHLYIITLGQSVDILCADYPKAKLVSRKAVEQLFNAIEVFGAA